jgi:hypothetical protein
MGESRWLTENVTFFFSEGRIIVIDCWPDIFECCRSAWYMCVGARWPSNPVTNLIAWEKHRRKRAYWHFVAIPHVALVQKQA